MELLIVFAILASGTLLIYFAIMFFKGAYKPNTGSTKHDKAGNNTFDQHKERCDKNIPNVDKVNVDEARQSDKYESVPDGCGSIVKPYGSDVIEKDYEYKIDSNEVTITKYIGTEENVVIPAKIQGFPVTKIEFKLSSEESIEKLFHGSMPRRNNSFKTVTI